MGTGLTADSLWSHPDPQHEFWNEVGVEQGLQNTCIEYLNSVFLELII